MSEDSTGPSGFALGTRVIASVAEVATVSGTVLSWGETPAPYVVIETYDAEEVVFLGPGVIVKKYRDVEE